MTTKAQQFELDNALVAPENRRVIGKCNMRINPGMKPKEPTYQVALDALALTTWYPAFLITAEVPVIYMHQFWAIVVKHKSSYQFKINKKRFSVNVKVFKEILNICPKVLGKAFDEPPTEEEALSFIRELGYTREIKYITDVSGLDKIQLSRVQILWGMYYKKNLDFVALIWEDLAYHIDNIDSKKQNKISLLKLKKVAAPKPKPTKKKILVKADKGKGLNVLSEVALSEAAQLKEVTKRSKKDFYISHASGSGDGTDFESGVPDEQHCKTSGTDERTGTKPGVPDVPKYDSESEKEYWGDSGEEDNDDENDSEDESDNGDNEDDGDDDEDGNNDDNQEDDDKNNDEEETDSDRSESNRIEIQVLNQSTTEYYKEEEEKDDDEEKMDDEEDDEVIKELYDDVNVNFGNRDTKMTDTDQGGSEQQNVSQELGFEQVEEDAHVTLTLILDTQKADEPVQSSSVSSDFTSKLLNLKNPSPANNEIASLMKTLAHHAMAVPEITSVFTKTIPHLPLFFNPLPQQATPTPTPTTSEATTLFPSLLDFSYVFKFNDRVTNMEKDLSEIKQVDQYAQALSSIPAIVNRYINNKLRDAINKAIQAHNLDCRQKAQDEKNEYIRLVDTSIRTIIKEENVAESLDAAVLKRSSSQPQSAYEAAVALFEFKLTKILIDKMEKNKSQDDRDKDQNPSAGSDRGTKRRKLSNEAESSKDSRSKEKKSSSTSKDASHSQQKPSGKSAYAEEPSHTVDDSGTWISQVSHAKEPHTSFNELMDTSFDFTAFVLNRLNIKNLTQEILVGPAFELLKGTWKSFIELEYHLEECSKGPKRQHFYGFAANKSSSKDVYSRKRIIAVTRLTIMKKYDYGHLEEIEVRRDDQKLYKRIVIQRRVEDYQLGVESYQNKLNLTKPDTFRSNLRNKTTSTAYSDPKGVIYKDQNNRNRLIRANELHKFSDVTLNDVRTALHDIAKGIRMEYLPKRK
ncbi:hypothetical protein Tco_1119637 [Tanacetum coccineum]